MWRRKWSTPAHGYSNRDGDFNRAAATNKYAGDADRNTTSLPPVLEARASNKELGTGTAQGQVEETARTMSKTLPAVPLRSLAGMSSASTATGILSVVNDGATKTAF